MCEAEHIGTETTKFNDSINHYGSQDQTHKGVDINLMFKVDPIETEKNGKKVPLPLPIMRG